jgi:hypothetical protein
MKAPRMLSLTVISNFALQHLRAASLFRALVEQLESEHAGEESGPFYDDIRSYCSACIMSSVASMEALINELFLMDGGRLRYMVELKGDFDELFWGRKTTTRREKPKKRRKWKATEKRGPKGIERNSCLKKYQLALTFLEKEPLDEQSDVYRDAHDLIEFRNYLVHFKPITWDLRTRRSTPLEELLAGRFPLSPFPNIGANFLTRKCMCSGAARWALETRMALTREFQSRAGLDPTKLGPFL